MCVCVCTCVCVCVCTCVCVCVYLWCFVVGMHIPWCGLVWCVVCGVVGACMHMHVHRFNMIMPAENIAAALAFSSLVRSLEEKVKTLTAENQGLESELTNTQVDLRAAKTDMAKHQAESQQALESLTKKCLAFEEELSKFGRL